LLTTRLPSCNIKGEFGELSSLFRPTRCIFFAKFRLEKTGFRVRLFTVPRIKIAAPAKLNLHLSVGNKRPDGFHDIESLFLALDFGDTLWFETLPAVGMSTEIRMDWRIPRGPEQAPQLSAGENIVSKAVSLFRDRTGYDEGLRITIEKRIPLGGGLGGGSSDAAAALLALNQLALARGNASADGAGLLDRETLAEMGAALGSDVPFFLSGAAAAWVGGRGELVRPIPLSDATRDLSFLLVNPGFHSDTAGAFRLLDEHRGNSPPTNPAPANLSLGTLRDASAHPPGDWPFRNDFLPAFAGQGKDSPYYKAGLAYSEIISNLKELGADFTSLSGSGSTCFGVFFRKNAAKSAKKRLLEKWFCVFEGFCLRNEVHGVRMDSMEWG